MNIVFLIGNGFDLNLGLNTRYDDFYKYYNGISSTNKNVIEFKNEIEDDIKNWSDLEMALGRYSVNFESFGDFDEVIDDVILNLSAFLEQQENRLNFANANTNGFYNDLYTPERHLTNADQRALKTFLEKYKGEQTNIRIITFNYTKVVEKILKRNDFNYNIPYLANNVFFKGLEHIHGDLENRMIIGVNDISQIANDKLHNDKKFINAFVKPASNKISKALVDDSCEEMIKKANLICIFGSSLGKSDTTWWQLIGQQLKKECRLVIFEKVENFRSIKPNSFSIHEEIIKDKFLERANIDEAEKQLVSERIFIGLNAKIFANLDINIIKQIM